MAVRRRGPPTRGGDRGCALTGPALLLPEVIRRGAQPGSPLGALLDVMEAMHAPAETALRGLPSILDPQTTPDDFVPFLATWVGLDDVVPDGVEFEAGVGRLRQLVATSAARAGDAAPWTACARPC